MLKISGLQKSSLLDYPDRISAVLFTHGCNLRCPYCHNPELVIEEFCKGTEISQKDLFEFLRRRVGKLEGVVITGGEPLLHNDLEEFVKKIKNMGYLVKLDTNGTFPKRLQKIIDHRLVDYLAMDVKYSKSQYIISSADRGIGEKIRESIEIIKNSGIDYEFRTTFVKKIHNLESAEKIGEMIEGANSYYIQNFRPGKTINPSLTSENSFTKKELEQIRKIMKKYVKNVYIR